MIKCQRTFIPARSSNCICTICCKFVVLTLMMNDGHPAGFSSFAIWMRIVVSLYLAIIVFIVQEFSRYDRQIAKSIGKLMPTTDSVK